MNEERFLMLQGHSPQSIKKTLNITNTIVYNDLNALTQKSKQYVYDMAKGTHVLMYQRAIEGIGLILSECWKVYNANADNKDMAALKLAKECNSEMMNFTMNGSTVLSINRITDRANRLGLLNENEKQQQQQPLTETDEINNYINPNTNGEIK